TEVFACGTAAIITPIGRFKSEKFDVTVADGGSGKLTCELRDELLGIQLGEVEDPHNWMWKVC
ncbi:MAG: branched chain amino acid aminotransferase, partial [Bifidobacterium longum]|nr:branched chain amino acid aminotransferase [Bifidobacterium longum]